MNKPEKVIVNINLEIPTPNAETIEEAIEIAENYELPHNYQEDSFEIIYIFDKDEHHLEKGGSI